MEKGKKYKGVTGSNTQAQCNARREIGIQIIVEHNFSIKKTDFYSEYRNRIARDSSIRDVTNRTLERDYYQIKDTIAQRHRIDFDFMPAKGSRKRKLFSTLPTVDPFALMSKNLFQIRITIGDYQNTLFSLDKNTFTDSIFAKLSINKIPEKYKNTNNGNDMVHIYLIFDMYAPRGIEETYCSIFENSAKDHNYYLLYTDAKNHCSEIVCTYNYLENVLEFTFLLFNRYWRNFTS